MDENDSIEILGHVEQLQKLITDHQDQKLTKKEKIKQEIVQRLLQREKEIKVAFEILQAAWPRRIACFMSRMKDVRHIVSVKVDTSTSIGWYHGMPVLSFSRNDSDGWGSFVSVPVYVTNDLLVASIEDLQNDNSAGRYYQRFLDVVESVDEFFNKVERDIAETQRIDRIRKEAKAKLTSEELSILLNQ